jgi:hypothetical protein
MWGKQSCLQAGIRAGFRPVPLASAEAGTNPGTAHPTSKLTLFPRRTEIVGRYQEVRLYSGIYGQQEPAVLPPSTNNIWPVM